VDGQHQRSEGDYLELLPKFSALTSRTLTRGPRACKFPVRFSSICSSRRATPWSRGRMRFGQLAVSPHPRFDAGRFLSFANATCALALGEQPLGVPAI